VFAAANTLGSDASFETEDMFAPARVNHRVGNDDTPNLFRLMSPEQKDQLFDNVKAAMEGGPTDIIKRQLVHLYWTDPEYGTGFATRMGVAVSDLPRAVAAE
jgi:catalase